MLIFWGISSLVVTIAVVMGTPLVYFLKRDSRWEKSDRSVETWHKMI